MADPLHVEVVSATRVVWSGEATNIIAKTIDGDMGILPGHEPVLAILVPGAIQVYCPDATREIFAVDGGFISVARGRVSILSEYAATATEVSLRDAAWSALVSTGLFALGSAAVTAYLRHKHITDLYAGASAVVLAVVWVYYSAQVFFFGACIGAALRERRATPR